MKHVCLPRRIFPQSQEPRHLILSRLEWMADLFSLPAVHRVGDYACGPVSCGWRMVRVPSSICCLISSGSTRSLCCVEGKGLNIVSSLPFGKTSKIASGLVRTRATQTYPSPHYLYSLQRKGHESTIGDPSESLGMSGTSRGTHLKLCT